MNRRDFITLFGSGTPRTTAMTVLSCSMAPMLQPLTPANPSPSVGLLQSAKGASSLPLAP
jgi:hypothetical protein